MTYSRSCVQECGVDWLVVVGPKGTGFKLVVDDFNRFFGSESEPLKGQNAYDRGLQWPCGAQLMVEHASSDWMATIRGKVCEHLGQFKLYELARLLLFHHQGHCTRLDLRRDDSGEGIPLIDDVISACESGYLRRLRRHRPVVDRTANNRILGKGVNLGSRKSELFIRIYDKGLEQAKESELVEPGEWVRFEVEYKGKKALKLAVKLFWKDYDQLPVSIAGYLHGAVDFRVGEGGYGTSLESQPQPEFWIDYWQGIDTILVESSPRERTTEGVIKWIRGSAGPKVEAYARHLGCKAGDVFQALCDGVAPSSVPFDSADYELLGELRERIANADGDMERVSMFYQDDPKKHRFNRMQITAPVPF